MSSTATSTNEVTPSPASLIRWQGALGVLRKRPWTAGMILLLSLTMIGAGVWFVVYPYLASQYHLRQARHAAGEYELARARRHLDACLQHLPGSAEAQFQMARTCRRAGDFPAARRHLQEAKRAGWDTDDIDLEYRLINAQTGAIRFAEAALLEFVGTGHRDEVYVLETLVQAYLDANFLDDAHRLAQYWIERYPDQWRPQLLRGLILERGQKLALAIDQYEKLLAWKPEQPDANRQLARILVMGKRYMQALNHFEAYRKERPNDPDALVGTARCLRELRGAEAALPMLEQALALTADLPEAHLLRGQILLSDLGKPEEALVSLRKADALVPNDLEIVGAMARALRHLKRDDEAKPYEEKSKLLEEEYRKLETLIRQIISTDQEKRTQPEARAKNVQLRYEAGMALMTMGRDNEGFVWLQSALQENPNHEPTRRVIQDYLIKTGKGPLGDANPRGSAPTPRSR